MALALADFPPEIIDRIFRLRNTSTGAMNLWLTGNQRIQHKLAAGVTQIKFINRTERILLRLPSFLIHLRALRELTVHRDSNYLMDLDNARKIFRQLSPSLRKVKFRFKNDGHVVSAASTLYGPNGTAADPSLSPWSLKAAFPNLNCLDLSMPEIDLEDLPENITRLGIALPSDHDLAISIVKSLSPQLLHLSITDGENFAELWPHFPRNLTELHHVDHLDSPDSITPEQLASLPRSLVKVSNFLPNYPKARTLESYPPHLAHFWLGGFIGENSFINFGAHFTNLREISSWSIGFDCTPQILQTLPSTLTDVKARFDLNLITAKDWPPTLTSVIMDSVNYPPKFENLPPTLKHLEVYRPTRSQSLVPFDCISKLPQSLLSFTAICGPVEGVDFTLPPNLTHLDIVSQYLTQWTLVSQLHFVPEDGEEVEDFNIGSYRHLPQLQIPATVAQCFPFERIPASVTHLRIGCAIPMSKLKLLPRRLRFLKTNEIFRDTDFDPQSQAEKDAMREVYEIGHAERVCDSLPSELPPVTFTALLPRTLTHLTFFGESVGPSALEWCKSIPKGIKSFNVTTGTLPADFVHHMPFDNLTKLNVLFDAPTDDHIRALPRNLAAKVRIRIRSADKLSQNAIMYWPPSALCGTDEEITSNWLSNLRDHRELHMVDSDPTFLQTLFSVDETVFPFSVLDKSPEEEAEE